MTFISLNLDEVQEQKPAPKGTYELMITAAQATESGERSKNPGSPLLKVTIGFVDQEVNAPVITHYLSLPFEGDENANFKALMLKRFLNAFKVGYSSEGIDVDNLAMELIGQTANLEVNLTEPNENGDVYNKIVVPRLRDEAVRAGSASRRRK